MDNKVTLGTDGWISGSCPDTDTRPEYSPVSVVLDVRQVLKRAGIDLDDLSPAEDRLAVVAAAQLLQALGVRPVGW